MQALLDCGKSEISEINVADCSVQERTLVVLKCEAVALLTVNKSVHSTPSSFLISFNSLPSVQHSSMNFADVEWYQTL